MNKKRIYLVFGDSIHITMYFSMYIFMILIAYFVSENANLWVYIIFSIVFSLLCFSTLIFVTLNKEGIASFGLFSKRYKLLWSDVTHSGITRKSFLKKRTCAFIYFSSTPFTQAPWEKLPNLSSKLIYFTFHKSIYRVLLTCGESQLAKMYKDVSLGPINVDAHRKLIGSTIILLCALLMLSIYYVTVNMNMLIIIIPILLHCACVTITVLDT